MTGSGTFGSRTAGLGRAQQHRCGGLAQDYYGRLFGWEIAVTADPQYGGYGMARLDGDDVAGIGAAAACPARPRCGACTSARPTSMRSRARSRVPEAPWSRRRSMSVIRAGWPCSRIPTGAHISAWQAGAMRSFGQQRPNTFGWAEVNSRDVGTAVRFYERVFGWTSRTSDVGADMPYTEFQIGGESIAGAWAMIARHAGRDAELLGGVLQRRRCRRRAPAGRRPRRQRDGVPPQDMPGGRFSLVSDPQGGMFGLLKMGSWASSPRPPLVARERAAPSPPRTGSRRSSRTGARRSRPGRGRRRAPAPPAAVGGRRP